MTNFNTSLSAFVPAARRDQVNSVLEALGFGPGNFSVAMSPSGVPVVTHYGLHAADDGTMQDVLDGTTDLSGIDFTSLPFTQAQANAAIASVIIHALPKDDNWGKANFDTGATNAGMKRIPKGLL